MAKRINLSVSEELYDMINDISNDMHISKAAFCSMAISQYIYMTNTQQERIMTMAVEQLLKSSKDKDNKE